MIIFVATVFLTISLSLFSQSSAFELGDPRSRASSELIVIDPTTSTQSNARHTTKNSWRVIDMHWLESSVFFSVAPRKLHIKPNLLYSIEHWPITSQTCLDLRDDCVSIPYAVDRLSKNAFLSEEILLTYSPQVLMKSISDLCEGENLTGENCRHLWGQLEDAIYQQGNLPNSTMTITLNGNVVLSESNILIRGRL